MKVENRIVWQSDAGRDLLVKAGATYQVIPATVNEAELAELCQACLDVLGTDKIDGPRAPCSDGETKCD